MQASSSFKTSVTRSERILTKAVVSKCLKSYFKDNYLGHVYENDDHYQKLGVDLWVITPTGLAGVDLKASTTSVEEALHLEIYSVREDRKLGYLLRDDSLCSYVLFIDAQGKWRMFSRKHLAQALRANFKFWVDRFGVQKQMTKGPWRDEGRYTSSTLRIPTAWVRGAYYQQASTTSPVPK